MSRCCFWFFPFPVWWDMTVVPQRVGICETSCSLKHGWRSPTFLMQEVTVLKHDESGEWEIRWRKPGMQGCYWGCCICQIEWCHVDTTRSGWRNRKWHTFRRIYIIFYIGKNLVYYLPLWGVSGKNLSCRQAGDQRFSQWFWIFVFGTKPRQAQKANRM